MKPFLGIDLTSDPKNQQINGKEFLIQIPSAALSQSLEASADQVERIIKKSKLPLPFRVIQFVCGICALLITSGILGADVSLEEGYQNAPWLFWTAGTCAVIWLVSWICSRQKAKTVLGSDGTTQSLSRFDGVSHAVYTQFAVPDDAKNIDILSFFYKVKNGNITVCEKAVCTQFYNLEFKVFADAENLYLANLEGKYAFPLSSIVKIHTVKKRIRIAGWNKEEKFNKGIYKQYKLSTDNYGCIHCKQYHIIEISHNDESFGIYIPSYELPVFEEVAK